MSVDLVSTSENSVTVTLDPESVAYEETLQQVQVELAQMCSVSHRSRLPLYHLPVYARILDLHRCADVILLLPLHLLLLLLLLCYCLCNSAFVECCVFYERPDPAGASYDIYL